MLRIILRNIRHTLVLSSVLLVVMALQRLHQFEFPLHSTSGRIEDFQPGEPSKVGIFHHATFRRDLKIGLFRFMFPRLEQSPDLSWLPDLDHSSIPKRRRNSIIMVDIQDCEESSIDAAILLKQTLQRCANKNIKIHGLIPDTCRSLNGSNVQFLDRWFDDIVVMDTLAKWQTRGHALAHHARLVIKVPLEATVACSDEISTDPPSNTTIRGIETTTHRHLSVESTPKCDIEWIRPNHKVISNSTRVSEQITQCCSTYPCEIPTTKIVLDYTFHLDCPRPWECNSTSYPTYACQLSLDHWYAERTNAFKGIDQPNACDENHNYVPMNRPK